LRFDVITLFDQFFKTPLETSIIKRAKEKGLFNISFYDVRNFGKGSYRQVDDEPFGGGPGMVMTAPALVECYRAIPKEKKHITYYLSPRGQAYNQSVARELLENFDQIILVCGHYEGVDQRFLDITGAIELSMGDFILTGGEIGALTLIDSVVRLLPGALGNEDSAIDESFTHSLLEYDLYTRPRVYEGLKVPKELLSGNHAKIDNWRLKNSLKVTAEKRPDLLSELPPNFFEQL